MGLGSVQILGFQNELVKPAGAYRDTPGNHSWIRSNCTSGTATLPLPGRPIRASGLLGSCKAEQRGSRVLQRCLRQQCPRALENGRSQPALSPPSEPCRLCCRWGRRCVPGRRSWRPVWQACLHPRHSPGLHSCRSRPCLALGPRQCRLHASRQRWRQAWLRRALPCRPPPGRQLPCCPPLRPHCGR